jgi:potassium-transporting ATPase potassium-binding subunit
MTFVGLAQIAFFSIVLIALAKPVGLYMARVFDDRCPVLEGLVGPLERFCYRVCGIDPQKEMHWTEYALALLSFSLAGAVLTYALLRLQGFLPLNPMGFSTGLAPAYATAMTPDLAFNTAMSFTSNTNWQNYSGEGTLSYFSQMVALAYHNWVSAAAGIAASVALVRGFARREANTIGNFWKDLLRCVLYILLPITAFLSLLLVWQGVIQNFAPYLTASTIEGASQIIPGGPVATQEAIKMLGTNGGGFFNANSAHPFENPTPFSNFIEMLAIFILPAGLTYMFGKMLKDTRQGWALLSAMFVLFICAALACYGFEAAGNPNVAARGVETSTRVLGDLGGNMEGKETRFGLANSALFATVTTDASCGAVNCMHDSLTPLGGMIPLLNIQLGEIVFGGVGSGLYGMLIFAVLTVFIAGLMVGRTPEYAGKKIESKDVKMCMLFVLAGCFFILLFTAAGSVLNLPGGSFLNAPGATYNNVNNGGPHGFSEILYCFSSATANNGSAFAGLNGNTPFYNITGGLAMLAGRFLMMIPALALAGSLVKKKYVPPSSGTFPTHSWLFVLLLISVILIVGALTFFPALTLGPIVEHFLMKSGRLF